MSKTDYKSVDAYLAAQPVHVRPILRRVREILRKALPGSEEVISYQIPAYKVGGRTVIYFAGWKEHYSLYPVTSYVVAALKDELAPFERSKGTLRFPLSKPVPARLIARIAKLKLAETGDREISAEAFDETGRSFYHKEHQAGTKVTTMTFEGPCALCGEN